MARACSGKNADTQKIRERTATREKKKGEKNVNNGLDRAFISLVAARHYDPVNHRHDTSARLYFRVSKRRPETETFQTRYQHHFSTPWRIFGRNFNSVINFGGNIITDVYSRLNCRD